MSENKKVCWGELHKDTDGEEREILTLPFTFPILNGRINFFTVVSTSISFLSSLILLSIE